MNRPKIAPRAVHSERAQWAWTKVSEVHGDGGKSSKEYATHVRKLPARIQINGLGQALAFLFSKSKEANGASRLLAQLGERLTPIIGQRGRDLAHPTKFMAAVVAMSPDQYRRSAHELATTAEWLKRFVDGLFDKEEE